MTFKQGLLSAATLWGCLVSSSEPLLAADMVAPAGCSVMGLVEGGGLYDAQHYVGRSSIVPIPNDGHLWSEFAEGAAGLTCDAWNFRADAAFYDFHSSTFADDTDLTNRSLQGHVGGAAFWRDQNVGEFGASGSLIFQGIDYNENPGIAVNDSQTTLRVGAFGKLFASDDLTLGASVHYFNGKLPSFIGGSVVDEKGWEFQAMAKHYATENLAFSIQGDASVSSLNSTVYDADMTGYAGTIQAEYLFPDSGLSTFIGGRYATRDFKQSTSTNTIDDKQIFAGLKFNFGAAANSSIMKIDRSGTYDNTSTFHEKLQNYIGSVIIQEPF